MATAWLAGRHLAIVIGTFDRLASRFSYLQFDLLINLASSVAIIIAIVEFTGLSFAYIGCQ